MLNVKELLNAHADPNKNAINRVYVNEGFLPILSERRPQILLPTVIPNIDIVIMSPDNSLLSPNSCCTFGKTAEIPCNHILSAIHPDPQTKNRFH